MFTVGREFEVVIEVGEGVVIHGLSGLEDGVIEDAAIEIGVGIGGIKFDGFVVVGENIIPLVEEEIGLPTKGVVTGAIGRRDT